ncbi:MAG: polyprenyl synthetase family protein [Paludibacteraceae bacterium]|nr:polyprenyl synthetase family protein [Paludibacteraceae bacterium]
MDINEAIQRLDWSKEPVGLYAPIGYTLEAGGKRLRPTLCLTAALLCGGTEQETLPAAMALEIFHNFTLLHDDVMDNAQVRRGRPCVHRKWNANTAILSGDQMMIEAYKMLAQLPDRQLPSVLRMFNRMATEICEGQQYDVDFEEKDNTTIEDYMNMIRLKTSVLLATALQIGAYLAGANDEVQHALYEYGILIGLAFQIQDDYLDCYGDEKTFGKAIGGDIREGKKTWLWLTAQSVLSHSNLPRSEQGGSPLSCRRRTDGEPTAKASVDNPLCSRDYDIVIAEYNRLGVPQKALQEIEKLTLQALTYLDKVPQNEYTDRLRQLANRLVTRKS